MLLHRWLNSNKNHQKQIKFSGSSSRYFSRISPFRNVIPTTFKAAISNSFSIHRIHLEVESSRDSCGAGEFFQNIQKSNYSNKHRTTYICRCIFRLTNSKCQWKWKWYNAFCTASQLFYSETKTIFIVANRNSQLASTKPCRFAKFVISFSRQSFNSFSANNLIGTNNQHIIGKLIDMGIRTSSIMPHSPFNLSRRRIGEGLESVEFE